MRAVARTGLAAHGIIWLLLGILALVMAFGGRQQETDQRGALEELAQHSGGWLLLLVITVGLAAYALWRIVDAFTTSETKERVSDVVRAIIYTGFAVSGVQILAQGHTQSQKKSQQSWTATIMQHTGGRWLVGIVGVVIVGVGAYLAYEGLTKKFEEHLVRSSPRWVTVLGMVGSTARGIVIALAGILTVVAAVTYDPKKAGGVDGALRTVREAPAGTVLLVLVALGLVMFGVFGCCEAKYRRV
jgi:Domain of Unknown Function (DUF1206)